MFKNVYKSEEIPKKHFNLGKKIPRKTAEIRTKSIYVKSKYCQHPSPKWFIASKLSIPNSLVKGSRMGRSDKVSL